MRKEVKEFRDGIFSLNTRRFGKVAELMIQKLFDLGESDNLAYDLKDSNGDKIEVKFSTVLKRCDSNISFDNLIESVIESNIDNRMLSFDEAKNLAFDCNIQQVKVREFDYLYYGCFFEDKIMICKIDANEILSDHNIMYSDHQHRGNVGEGQFHINNSTLENHLEQYLIQWLLYDDLFELFQ